MMQEEKELIGRLKKLRQIQPKREWVSSVKSQILGQEQSAGFTLFPYFKPVFAGLIAVFILFGAFGYDLVRNSMPGDLLYAIKKVVHESREVFTSESEKPIFQLKLANDRLEDLTKAPAKNLAPTISEFQANITDAAKGLAKIDAATPDPVIIKKIIDATNELEGNIDRITSLGVVVGDETMEEFKSVVEERKAKWVEDIIASLENQAALGVLAESEEKVLNQIKGLFAENKYSEALELYLISQ